MSLSAASLKKMMPNKCTVTRDGQEQKVDAHELVPGDLVRLYIGDRVPADIRIIETSDLKVRRHCRPQHCTCWEQRDTCDFVAFAGLAG
jgi:magnesium-transporting ATPase (P-type)